MIRHIWLLLIILALSACGRKGSLVRPEALVPGKVSDFQAMQQGEAVQLSWSLPKLMESGGRLTDLSGFRLFVREISTCPDCTESWLLLNSFDFEFLNAGSRIGDRIYYSDNRAREGVPSEYRVVSYTKSAAESGPAEIRFTKNAPLPAPALKSEASHLSVMLECIPSALPQGIVADGCTVYRSKAGEPISLIPYAKIAAAGKFEDTQLEYGVIYNYSVSVVSRINGQITEGVLSSLSTGLRPAH